MKRRLIAVWRKDGPLLLAFFTGSMVALTVAAAARVMGISLPFGVITLVTVLVAWWLVRHSKT